MRCLLGAISTYLLLFKEIESSGAAKKLKLQNEFPSKANKDETRQRTILKRVRKSDSRHIMVDFKHTTDPEETYHLYGQYYADRDEPPAKSGSAAMQLYHKHFPDGPQPPKYDYCGERTPSVLLGETIGNLKEPSDQQLHHRNLSSPLSVHPLFRILPLRNNSPNVEELGAYRSFKEPNGHDLYGGSGLGSEAG